MMMTTFAVAAVYICLWMLQTTLALETDQIINDTVSTYTGAKSVELSCNGVPEDATAIEWFIKVSYEWVKILTFYHTIPGKSPKWYNYSRDKYDISEIVKTSLVVKNVEMLDNDLFKCSSRGGSLDYKYTISLKIMDPPEVIVEGTRQPAVEYTKRNLECRARGGNPSHQVSYSYLWLFKPTHRDSAVDINLPYGSTVINNGRNLQLQDLGYKEMAGTYKCIVTGIGGESSGSGTLEVYYAAKSENSAEDMVVYTALESAANVTVKFHMNPVSNFTVHWSMGSSVLHDSNIKHTVTDNHVQTTYFISYVTNTQLGNYIVRVINFAIKNKPNEAIFKVKLKQRGPPEKPVNVSILAKSNNSITVGWEAGLNGGSEQHFKILYRETGKTAYQEIHESITGLRTGQSINYTIHGLDEKKEYKITVVAINQFGSSSQTVADAVITEDNGKLNPTTIAMGVSLGLMAIIVIIIGSALCKIKKCQKGKSQVKRTGSQEYDGLKMSDREQSTNVPGVYRDLRRNTRETTDAGGYEIIPDTAFTEPTVDSDYTETVASTSKTTGVAGYANMPETVVSGSESANSDYLEPVASSSMATETTV